MKKKLNILITHASYQAISGSFLKQLRFSGIFDFYIVGADILELGYCSASILVDKYYKIDNLVVDEQYIKQIKEIMHQENIDVILSADEHDLILFKNNNISQACLDAIPDESIFNLFKDKYLATVDVEKHNVNTPSLIIDKDGLSTSFAQSIIQRKRVSSSSRGIKIYAKDSIPPNYVFYDVNYITQEYLDGDLYTIDVLCDKEGNAKLIVPRKDLVSKDGTTFKCEIIKNDRLLKICERIYQVYKIPGISNIQFIQKSNNIYFIELNVRAAATIIATSLSSINILDIYINHFYNHAEMPSYSELMSKVHWNSVISRYYEETILLGKVEKIENTK